jgi:Ca2+-binding EF-hand superfamily protein
MSTERQLQQLQKYRKLFERLDADYNGTIEEADIATLVQSLCNIYKVQPDSPEGQRSLKSAHKMWQDLLGYDTDGNKQVSRDEWEAAFKQPNFIDNVVIPHAILHFEMNDTNKDGKISKDEFIYCQRHYLDMEETESESMFQRFDTNGDGYITLDEYTNGIKEFYKSD